MKNLGVLTLIISIIIYVNALQSIHQDEAQQAYLDSLLKMQTQLSQKIQNLKQVNSDFNKQKQFVSGQASLQTSLLQQAILKQRQKLFEAESNFYLPLKLKTWDCNKITQEQKNKIIQDIIQVKKHLSIVKKSTEKYSGCLRNDQILYEVKNLKLHLKNLENQLANSCSIHQKPKLNIPNLQATNNWIYGQKQSKEYEQEVYNLGLTNQLVNCPTEKPFVDASLNCISCQKIYDLSTKQCTNCPQKQKLNQKTHKCEQQCPQNSFSNGQKCIKCKPPATFNLQSKVCNCQEGLIYNAQTQQCINKKKNSNPAVQNNVGTRPLQDKNLQTCPKQTPIFNGKQCIECKMPKYFDFDTLTCKQCQDQQNQVFNIASKKCVEKQKPKEQFSSNTEKSKNYIGQPPKQSQNKHKCPQQKPFFDGSQCINCQYPKFFNFGTQICEHCPQNLLFSQQKRTCIKKQQNAKQFNTNLIKAQNFAGDIPPVKGNNPTCKQSAPYFNGKECVSCDEPKYFDLNKKQCVSCQENKIFNTVNRMCQHKTHKYITNVKDPNIFFNGDYNTNVEAKVQSKQKENKDIQKCPLDNPYYNASSGKCMNCPKDTPLFDFKYNRCIKCKGGSYFENHMCVSKGQVPATIERMIMNGISWI